MRLVAVTVSGRRSRVEEFRIQPLHSLSTPGELGPESSTAQHGNNGLFGIISGLEIHFKRLRI